jgi:hypothetical protein
MNACTSVDSKGLGSKHNCWSEFAVLSFRGAETQSAAVSILHAREIAAVLGSTCRGTARAVACESPEKSTARSGCATLRLS